MTKEILNTIANKYKQEPRWAENRDKFIDALLEYIERLDIILHNRITEVENWQEQHLDMYDHTYDHSENE